MIIFIIMNVGRGGERERANGRQLKTVSINFNDDQRGQTISGRLSAKTKTRADETKATLMGGQSRQAWLFLSLSG